MAFQIALLYVINHFINHRFKKDRFDLFIFLIALWLSYFSFARSKRKVTKEKGGFSNASFLRTPAGETCRRVLDVPLLVTKHSENHRRSGTSTAIEEKNDQACEKSCLCCLSLSKAKQ